MDSKLPLALIILFCLAGSAYAAIDQEIVQAVQEADCNELVEEYKEAAEAEQQLLAALQENRTQTVVTNVAGVAALATLGLGIFTWNDTSEAEAYLADVREYINAIKASAQNKKCQPTQQQSEPPPQK